MSASPIPRTTGPMDMTTTATVMVTAASNYAMESRSRARATPPVRPSLGRTAAARSWCCLSVGGARWCGMAGQVLTVRAAHQAKQLDQFGSRRPSPAPAASNSPPAVVRSGSSVRAGAVEACSRPAPPGWPRNASNAARAAPHRRAGSVAGQLGKHRGATKRSGAAADTRRLRDTGRPDRPRGTPATTGGSKHRGGRLAAVLVAGGAGVGPD